MVILGPCFTNTLMGLMFQPNKTAPLRRYNKPAVSVSWNLLVFCRPWVCVAPSFPPDRPGDPFVPSSSYPGTANPNGFLSDFALVYLPQLGDLLCFSNWHWWPCTCSSRLLSSSSTHIFSGRLILGNAQSLCPSSFPVSSLIDLSLRYLGSYCLLLFATLVQYFVTSGTSPGLATHPHASFLLAYETFTFLLWFSDTLSMP